MDSILIVLIIYELQWDDVDEDGEGWGGLQMYVVLPQEPQKYSTHTFFKNQ